MSRVAGALLAAWVTAPDVAAYAQGSGKRWEVEAHTGGTFASSPAGGTPIAQFPVGTPISTGGPVAGSRAVSSWYFGDGTTLINQVNAGFNVASRLTPLDSMLTRPAVRRTHGAGFGVRVGRALTPRVVAEFNLDYHLTTLQLNDETREAIEQARSSFISAWNALLLTGATTSRSIASTADIADGDNNQTSAIGAIKFRFKPEGRMTPYVTAGAGALFQDGDAPVVTLTGTYGFSFAGLFPINERDQVTVRVVPEDRVFLGIVGGGVEFDIPPGRGRHGVRADVRVHMSANTVDTLVNATPSITVQSPIFFVSTGIPPSIQFSNDPRTGRASSLSGPPIADLRTFTASGTQTQVLIGVGYFWRF
jgi:hypothetical protein